MRRGLGLMIGLGFGIGLTAAGLLMAAGNGDPVMPPDAEVRERARALGMVDPTVLPTAQPVREVYLLLTPDTGWQEAGALLKQAGLLADEAAVLELVKARGLEKEPIQPGVYRLQPSLTPTQAVDLLTKGPGS